MLALIPMLLLITKAIEIGGDILPVALRAFAALRVDHPDVELIALAREKNELDEMKILDLIERAEAAMGTDVPPVSNLAVDPPDHQGGGGGPHG